MSLIRGPYFLDYSSTDLKNLSSRENYLVILKINCLFQTGQKNVLSKCKINLGNYIKVCVS